MSNDIIKLSEFSHARLRTEMWLGSRDAHTQQIVSYEDGRPSLIDAVWVPAVFTAFREVLDNALDEVVTHGNGDRIDVSYNPKTMVFKIADNGRGIPFHIDKTHKQCVATMALTETKAGRNFGDRGATRGLNGVGASIVNFCSEYFEATITRDKKTFIQRFHEGDGKNNDLVIENPLIVPCEKNAPTGTSIEFKLSAKVFKDLTLPEDFLKSRMFEVALCYPKLKLYYNGKKVIAKDVGKTIFPDHKPIFLPIEREGFNSKFWLVPLFFENGEHAHSLVNAIFCSNGGTHIDTFRRFFFSGMLGAMERESKKRKLTPNRSDLSEGMLIYSITEMDAPSFDSQSKTRLINDEVASIIKEELADPEFFKKVIKTNPEWVEEIYTRCAERTMKKDLDETKKLAKKASRVKVENLIDACATDRKKCILFITEGLSALSTLVEVRNPEIHGGLPLRGKILNVNGASLKEVLENEVIMKIANSIGLVPGRRAVRDNLRYGKVYITADSDYDGKSITTLVCSVFYNLWPELFSASEEAFIYVFDTPLVIAEKGKTRKYWFANNYHEFDPELYKGYSHTYAKGLGALTSTAWTDMLASPHLTPLIDDGELEAALSLLFDKTKADDRKLFMGISAPDGSPFPT